MATINFKQVELFGGAMTVNVPAGFADTSDIRQVPDHQEVYLSVAGFTSLIFDLGERVSHLASDKEAVEYHFDDMVDESDTTKVWTIDEAVKLPNFPHTATLSLLATTKPSLPSGRQSPRANTPTRTTILLTLIRLGPQCTDMAITLNVPHIPGGPEAAIEEGEDIDYEKGSYGPAIEEAKKIMGEVSRTLVVKDWGLFGDS